ncbi:DUF1775 domain-containing protein [Agrococcus jenensis]|uniref:Uncharacterized protein YcnI n=1 Tax=Agrococcus jenensis TaxID=46353 RepID=A0A3N2AQ70_9MICO|nr:DUF1775 domain-containing protein [Agrococcus jenensis]ROR64852.1 uncharacterized protein YcnI [Agrococcus jenensis]
MTTTRPRTRRSRAVAGLGAGIAATALVVLGPAAAASAHVHVTPSSTEAGATSELAFTFSHGCDGSPTTGVVVTIPDGVSAVTLIANPGWDVALDVADGRVVRFTADEPMPDGVRETLELEVTLPEDAADGTVLAFPALQSCEVGESDWSSDDQASETPAPILTIGEAAEAHGHGAAAGGTEAAGAEHAEHEAEAAAAPAADGGSGATLPVAIAALVAAAVAAVLSAIALRRQRATR